MFSLLCGGFTSLSAIELPLTELTTDNILLQRVQSTAQLIEIDLWRLHVDPKSLETKPSQPKCVLASDK